MSVTKIAKLFTIFITLLTGGSSSSKNAANDSSVCSEQGGYLSKKEQQTQITSEKVRNKQTELYMSIFHMPAITGLEFFHVGSNFFKFEQESMHVLLEYETDIYKVLLH